MKKLPMTKEAFEKSRYFTNKYGKLEYVSESGKLFKTNKGKILKFSKEGTESNPRFKCMEGHDYSDEILEFRKDVINALKQCYDDKYLIEQGTYGKNSIFVTDPTIGIDFRLDISVSDDVEM